MSDDVTGSAVAAAARLASALSDRYTIERELGQGGMATVYLAHDMKHDRQVAIKVLKPELGAALGAERFLAEIRTTASPQHPAFLRQEGRLAALAGDTVGAVRAYDQYLNLRTDPDPPFKPQRDSVVAERSALRRK